MDLIDRYLAAVRRNLPADKAADITAELEDELLARKEAREARIGRALDKEEASKLLKDFGHPLLVASRYRKHQYLIGPEVFPFYVAVMRVVLLVILAIFVAIGVANLLFSTHNPVQAMLQTFSGIWLSILGNVAIITIVFAVLERNGFPAEHLVNWIPDQLPKPVDKQPGPWESAFEVAGSIAFLLWWTGVINLPYATGSDQFRLEPDPVFHAWYWPILILASVQLVHNLMRWLLPSWRLLAQLLGVATAGAGLALAAMLYQAGHWATVVSTGMPAAQAADLDRALNLSFKITFVVIGVIATLGILRKLWRIARLLGGKQ